MGLLSAPLKATRKQEIVPDVVGELPDQRHHQNGARAASQLPEDAPETSSINTRQVFHPLGMAV
jgi:hypothetical protein